VNAGLLLYLLSRRIGGGDFPRILTTFVKTCVAAAVMGVVAYYSERWLHGVFDHPTIWHRALRVVRRDRRGAGGARWDGVSAAPPGIPGGPRPAC
jgi:hypothetical protein